MLEIVSTGTYQEFKTIMDAEIREAAQGFVRIGYLLKVARDTEILKESGYASVADFAKAEYGLTKDMVSRYIAINDKYSENGYSDVLQTRYQDFGVAKLAEMLTLPEVIADELTPDITKREIQEIKHDLREEQERTDLEVMIEQAPDFEAENELESLLYEYFRDWNRYLDFCTLYVQEIEKAAGLVGEIEKVFADKDRMLELLAPKGIENIRVRVPQVGKMMLTISGTEEPVTVINMRTMAKNTYDWNCVSVFLKKIFMVGADTWKDAYASLYGKMPENTEVAPVQQSSETAEIQNVEPVLEESKEPEKAEVENVEKNEDIVEESDNMEESKEETDEENAKMEQYNASILPEDTETSEEDEKKAKILHVLKMLEKYHEYLNEDDLRVLEAMLEDGKRRKREYGAFDVGSTL